MAVPIGRRQCLVTIQARVPDAADAAGYPSEAFTSLSPGVWMSQQEATTFDRSAEQFEAGQITTRTYTEWRMPYRPDMDPDRVDVPKQRRLLYRSRVYDITQAVLIDRHQIKLTTLARVG
jgi:hypothetical protein